MGARDALQSAAWVRLTVDLSAGLRNFGKDWSGRLESEPKMVESPHSPTHSSASRRAGSPDQWVAEYSKSHDPSATAE